jgi:lysophospholipase L1-like esterase
MRRLLLRLSLFAASTAIALLAAEGFFRWWHPRLGAPIAADFYTLDGTVVPHVEIMNFWARGGGYMGGKELVPPCGRLTPSLRIKQGYDRPRWRYFDAQGAITIEHDSRGFRDDEFPVEKPAGEFRVLALGDSSTYGSGVNGPDTWPQVFERRLRATGRTAQVVNAGLATGSYTPVGYETWMQSDGLQFAPDLVVVGFVLNDMGGNNGFDVPMVGYPLVKPEPVLGGHSWLLDYWCASWRQRQAKLQPVDFAAVVRAQPAQWQATQQSLVALRDLLQKVAVPLVVLVLPMMSHLDVEPMPYAGLHTLVAEFCRGQGIACFDALPAFRGGADTDFWVHPGDNHPNDAAHARFAAVLWHGLAGAGLLPTAPR